MKLTEEEDVTKPWANLPICALRPGEEKDYKTGYELIREWT